MGISSLPALTDRPRLPQPKGQARVVDRIQRKAELAKIERECRKAVKARDQGRCRVPGCRKRAVQMHHIQFRSQLGKWQTRNVVSLCLRDHQLVHAGILTISGNADQVIQCITKEPR